MKEITLKLTSTFDNNDYDILLDGEKIGYVATFEFEDFCYIATIELKEEHRNHGYGTKVIKMLAEKFGCAYLCPENDDAERLYIRIGEELSYSEVPDELEGSFDEYGKMYVVY